MTSKDLLAVIPSLLAVTVSFPVAFSLPIGLVTLARSVFTVIAAFVDVQESLMPFFRYSFLESKSYKCKSVITPVKSAGILLSVLPAASYAVIPLSGTDSTAFFTSSVIAATSSCVNAGTVTVKVLVLFAGIGPPSHMP